MVQEFTPDYTSSITGIAKEKILDAAKMYGQSPSAVVMLARGAEQQHKGADNVSAYINLALVTGNIGRPKSGVATLTGQANGQGGRVHGQKSDLLPGARKITFCFGGNVTVFPAIVGDFFGLKNHSKNYGIVYQGFGIGALSGSFIAAMLGGFKPTFIVVGVLCIVSSIIAVLIKAPNKPEEKRRVVVNPSQRAA